MKRSYFIIPIGIVVFFGLIWMVIQLNRPDRELLSAWADARAKAGLRPIQKDWVFGNYSPEDGWVSWGSYPGAPVDTRKVLHFDGKTPISEEDSYSSGRQYPSLDGDGTEFEKLSLQYDYKTRLCAVVLVTDNRALEKKVEGKMSREGVELSQAYAIADEILRTWGMKREDATPGVR